VIVLTDDDVPDWLQPTETISWTLRDVLDELPYVELQSYERSEQETIICVRALALLSEATGQFSLRARTRPALHASILRLIARLSGEHPSEVGHSTDTIEYVNEIQGEGSRQAKLLQEAWAVLDALDDLGPDGRLEAVYVLALRAEKDHRSCIVTTELAAEADYVAGYFRSRAIPVSLLTAANTDSEWHEAQAILAESGVLITTNALLGLLDLPRRTQVVWWSAPHDDIQAQEWLAFAARAPYSTVIAIVAHPPPPGEYDVQTRLDTLRRE
jgi:hypothetical protein